MEISRAQHPSTLGKGTLAYWKWTQVMLERPKKSGLVIEMDFNRSNSSDEECNHRTLISHSRNRSSWNNELTIEDLAFSS